MDKFRKEDEFLLRGMSEALEAAFYEVALRIRYADDQCVLLAKLYEPLLCFILYSKAKFDCYSRYFLTSYFCIPLPYNEKDIFFGF